MKGPRKIFQGQELAGIPASGWNGFVDTYHKVAQWPATGNGSGQATADDRSVIVLLVNGSGSDVPQGGVLKLATPVATPTDRAEVVLEGLAFNGDTPGADDPNQHIAIACEPIADEGVGYGFIPNATWAKVNVSDAGHKFAKPKASVAELESGGSGYPIIWKESGTGAGKWAVVSLVKSSTMNVIHGQAVGAVSGGGFDIDHIELKNGIDPREDTGDDTETVEVENPFGWDIDDNGLVRAEQADDGTWIAVQVKCPAE